MKISIENLGPLRKADFSLGDLTIICGPNNTGKTYATYATYGFFSLVRSAYPFDVKDDIVQKLLRDGTVSVNLVPYAEGVQKHLAWAAKQYSNSLAEVFAGNKDLFSQASFSIEIDNTPQCRDCSLKRTIGTAERSVLQVVKEKGQDVVVVSLMVDRTSSDVPPRGLLEEIIGDQIRDVVIHSVIPRPFISSAERTGSAIFQKELDFTRNRLVELLGDEISKLHPFQLLDKFSGKYPIPVRRNVDFIRSLPNIATDKSFIAEKHEDALRDFVDIIGGRYKISRDEEVIYIPEKSKKVKLSLVESSSSVRSLLDVGFYLRHVAKRGDLFVIDEPELNLHPENQRRIARLFARMVNWGIRVLMTTHSDYIIKEINTLIMLNSDRPNVSKVMEREGYRKDEVLSAERVRVYMAKDDLLRLAGRKRRVRGLTLVAARVDPDVGIEAETFDRTINEMNRIQTEILIGSD